MDRAGAAAVLASCGASVAFRSADARWFFQDLRSSIPVAKPIKRASNTVPANRRLVSRCGKMRNEVGYDLTSRFLLRHAGEIASAQSRDDELVKDLGAHQVIDHGKPIAAQVAALGLGAPGFVFSTTHTADHTFLTWHTTDA
jgi:hypothetical protein